METLEQELSLSGYLDTTTRNELPVLSRSFYEDAMSSARAGARFGPRQRRQRLTKFCDPGCCGCMFRKPSRRRAGAVPLFATPWPSPPGSGLADAALAVDGCRAAAYVDSHCHLEVVLHMVRRHETVPTLIRSWWDFTVEERRNWMALGWTCRQWESVSGPQNRIWTSPWRTLTPTQKASARALGWSASSWEAWEWRLPAVAWSRLRRDARKHLQVLGESRESWEEERLDEKGTTGAGEGGDGRTWRKLTSKEQDAASKLGFTAATWDFREMADVHRYIVDFCGTGFQGCITSGCDPDSIDEARDLALSHDQVFVAFGCHPKSAWMYDEAFEERLLTALAACGDKALAWGEFGLDFSLPYWAARAEYRRQQEEVFVRQLKLALERNMPLVLHIREATNDALRVLRQWVPRHWRAHVHGNHCTRFVAACLTEWPNFYFGLTGTVTMGWDGEDMAMLVPVGRMLLETDAPFLAPRGTNFNHLGQIPFIARAVAELKGCDPAQVLSASRTNTRFVYGI